MWVRIEGICCLFFLVVLCFRLVSLRVYGCVRLILWWFVVVLFLLAGCWCVLLGEFKKLNCAGARIGKISCSVCIDGATVGAMEY